MNKFYIIFYFILNSLAWGQTQVIPSLEASASSLTPAGSIPVVTSPGVLGPANGLTASITPTVTTLTVKAGAGQSSTNLQEWQNNAGTVLASVGSSGDITTSGNVTLSAGLLSITSGTAFAGGGYRVGNAQTVTWSNGTNFTNTSLSRISDGVVGVGTGVAGSTAGTLQAKSVAIISPVVPATAADACTAGAISWDASYIYVCTASGAWKRSAIATW